MDKNTIGINRFSAMAMFSTAISSILSGGVDPSTTNLRAVATVIDGILGLEKQFFGEDAVQRRAAIGCFRAYKDAIAGAMSLKKHERGSFLRESNVQMLKKMMAEHGDLIKADMAKLDKNERAAFRSAIDAVVRPELRVVK